MPNEELPDELWREAHLYFGEDVGLKRCGDGVHPANKSCANCIEGGSE